MAAEGEQAAEPELPPLPDALWLLIADRLDVCSLARFCAASKELGKLETAPLWEAACSRAGLRKDALGPQQRYARFAATLCHECRKPTRYEFILLRRCPKPGCSTRESSPADERRRKVGVRLSWAAQRALLCRAGTQRLPLNGLTPAVASLAPTLGAAPFQCRRLAPPPADRSHILSAATSGLLPTGSPTHGFSYPMVLLPKGSPFHGRRRLCESCERSHPNVYGLVNRTQLSHECSSFVQLSGAQRDQVRWPAAVSPCYIFKSGNRDGHP